MSIVVSVMVGEGIVIATDSALTVTGSVGPQKVSGTLKVYGTARKLTQFKDLPIAVCSFGLGRIGPRNIESLVNEFENNFTSPVSLKVSGVAQELFKFVKDKYYSTFTKDNKPSLGLLVVGYSHDQFFPEQYLLAFPNHGDIQAVRPYEGENPNFGANFFGMTDAIVRLHKGYDQGVLEYLVKRGIHKDTEEAGQILNQFEYPVLFDAMPLQDAIEYAIYLVNVVIGRFRFVIGAPLCVGPVDVAAITRKRGFQWIQQKTWGITQERKEVI